MLVIFGWDRLIREGALTVCPNPARGRQKLRALVALIRSCGPTCGKWCLRIFTVSGVGIFVAVRLDEIFRQWPAREERLILTGHWHVLSAIIATIILLYYGDMIGLKGWVRRLYGWGIILSPIWRLRRSRCTS